MSASSVYMLNFNFYDRDANQAQVTVYLSVSVSVEDAFAFALETKAKMLNISDALINRVQMLWKYQVDPITPAAMGSNVRKGMLLFIENEQGDINGVRIPSPKSDLFEQTGKYMGIRLDKTNSNVVQFQSLLLTQDFKTFDGRQLGNVLLTGGLAL